MAHYVNNPDFLQAMREYRALVQEHKDQDKDPPQIPDYIGSCILQIATKFASRPNFYGYSYKDEMIGDAIENCLQYVGNFDPEKSNNPFAYFTQICYFAFIRRIMREKKQSYIKHKLVCEMPFDTYDLQDSDNTDLSNNFMTYIQTHNNFDGEAFERKLNKRKKKKPEGLEELMDIEIPVDGEIEV
jgi:hypothetical protein